MEKRYWLIPVIAVIVILVGSYTYTAFPSYLREEGNMYTDFEKSQWFLSDDEYDKIKIEYDYVEGCRPKNESLEFFNQKVSEICGEKDQVIDVMDDKIKEKDVKINYREEEVIQLGDTYQDIEREGKTVPLHVIYLNGLYEEKNVLGLTYNHMHIVLFKQSISRVVNASSWQSEDPEKDMENSVLLHEFGHIISLVGIGYQSDHEIERHHCNEEAGECVMDASVEVKMNGFSEKPPTDLCSLCNDDIGKIKEMEDDRGPEDLVTYIIIIGEVSIGISWTIAILRNKKEKEEIERRKEYEKDNDVIREY